LIPVANISTGGTYM